MDVKKLLVATFNEGISLIKKHYGEEGVIIASRKVGNEWEIIAAANEKEASKYGMKKKNQALFEKKKNNTAAIQTEKSEDTEEEPEQLVTYKPLARIKPIEEEFSEQDSFISEFRNEINDIKAYLESQHASAVWKDFKYENELNSLILKKMYQSGFSLDFSQKIITETKPSGNLSTSMKSIAKTIKNQMAIDEQPFNAPGIYCLMGPPGCGKTSLILKIAMTIKKNNKNCRIHLFNCDFESLSQVDQLNRIGHLLDMDVHHLDNSMQQLANAIFTEEDYIFIDLPNQPALIQVIQSLNVNDFFKTPIQYCLVIDNNWDKLFVNKLIAQCHHLKEFNLVFTKCDMQTRYATMIESSITFRTKIALLSFSALDPKGLKKPSSDLVYHVFEQKEGKDLTDFEIYTMIGS